MGITLHYLQIFVRTVDTRIFMSCTGVFYVLYTPTLPHINASINRICQAMVQSQYICRYTIRIWSFFERASFHTFIQGAQGWLKD